MEKLNKFFNYANLAIGFGYFLFLVFFGFIAGSVTAIVIFLIFTALHVGAGIGPLTSQPWAALAVKINAWVGTVLFGISFIVGIFKLGRAMAGIARVFGPGAASGGFLISLATALIMFVPFIFFYFSQIVKPSSEN